MHSVRSAGVLLSRTSPTRQVLLLRHADRFDLPKGHVEAGESDVGAALRELWEETGIPAEAIELDEARRYSVTYQTPYKRRGGAVVEKTVVIFAARLLVETPLRLTEHAAGGWVDWRAGLTTGNPTIDGALAALG
ncbi:MAG: bis(5'-nucleosidyl)-tetraphosphatase [Myxococcota bacterium]